MGQVKVLIFHPDRCKGDRSCERACSKIMHKNDLGGDYSALMILKGQDGTFSMTDCNHCGLCIDMCPVQAIKRAPSGIVIIDRKVCVGCLSCVSFCPQHVMRRAPGLVVPHKCISCGSCVKACPHGALELVEKEISDLQTTVYHKQGVCP